jgi:hypothetical protein
MGKEHTLRMFENRVLRRLFAPKRDEVIEILRKLHNEELCNLYPSLCKSQNDQVKEDGMGKACSTHGEKPNAHWILMGKPEKKKPLGRPRRRWQDSFKMDVRGIGWGVMDWIDLA